MTQRKTDQIIALLKSIETGDPGPIAVVNQDRYVQHNPQTHEGSEGLESLFKRLSQTNPRITAIRAFEDGDFVFAQMLYDFSAEKVCFEVFRFEDGRTVEHWDNIQTLAPPNASGRSMIDGATDLRDHTLTESNRARVRSFVTDVLIAARPDLLDRFIAVHEFAEHNPEMSDDLTQLRAALLPDGQNAAQTDYQVLHRVLADGNFALAVSEGRKRGTHTAFYDLFRLDQDRIVEHWDTTETVAPKHEWKNDNGKF